MPMASKLQSVERVQDDQSTVRLVKQYERPETRQKPTPDDVTARLKVEIKMLEMSILEFKDQRRRLREEIEDTIKMLTAAMEERKEETFDQVRRRISRLKGALEYRGQL